MNGIIKPVDIYLYNTMSRTKEKFEPLEPGKVGLYTCGPTVYNYAHIGNLRTFLFEDLLARMFRLNGYEVTHVMNITDVGHMTSDGDEGEDKMSVAAAREQKTPWELARFYEDEFLIDMERLGIRRPDVLPRATEHIQEMIEVNQRLEAQGFTYTTDQGLYFDTGRDPDYGKLDRKKKDDQIQAAREDVNVDTQKRDPADFVLWFTNKPNHVMQWDSPWGRGYPGWHIECSAMSMKYLGETFDVHCGGNDHIPVHHTNEIAQSECATGHPFVNYWMHTAFLVMGGKKMSKSGEEVKTQGKKMSKSGGTFLKTQVLIDSGYDPLAYRYLCLQAHYRAELALAWEWNDDDKTGSAESLDNAANGLERLYERIARAEDEPLTDDSEFETAYSEVLMPLNDDLNVPKAIATLHTYGSPRLWRAFDGFLGLDFENRAVKKEEEAAPAEILALVEKRQAARKARDFARSDVLRDQIAALGYEVADTPQGPTVKRK